MFEVENTPTGVDYKYPLKAFFSTILVNMKHELYTHEEKLHPSY